LRPLTVVQLLELGKWPVTGVCDGCVGTAMQCRCAVTYLAPQQNGVLADDDHRLRVADHFLRLAEFCGPDNRHVPRAALLEVAHMARTSMRYTKSVK
jgi:hypothetical protein